MNKLSIILSSITLTLSISSFAITEQNVKAYDGKNFDEVVCRFYLRNQPNDIERVATNWMFSFNRSLRSYDLLAQVYRGRDSNLYYSIYSGFLKSEGQVFFNPKIPKDAYEHFRRVEKGGVVIANDAKNHNLFGMAWNFIDSIEEKVTFLILDAQGPLCKEILTDDQSENLKNTLNILTSSFYNAANYNSIPGVVKIER